MRRSRQDNNQEAILNYTHHDILLAEKYGSPVSQEPLPQYRCQGCGELVLERFECELCRKNMCENCIIHNILNTGWDVCEDCSNNRIILEEARDLACAQLARTGSHKDLHAYLMLRIELERRTDVTETH